jgi:hypothetical protein
MAMMTIMHAEYFNDGSFLEFYLAAYGERSRKESFNTNTDYPSHKYGSGPIIAIWCKNGSQHRINGPAVVRVDGSYNWCLFGKEYTFAEFIKKTPILEHEKVELALIYG